MAALRSALRRSLVLQRPVALVQAQHWRCGSSKALSGDAIDELLSKSTWSVKELQSELPLGAQQPEITKKQLHHLLRLSALPLPGSSEEEAKMIKTLQAQLHFVRAIQSVDTAGVEPLQSIRDETSQANDESEITVDTLKAELAKEKQVGFARRVVREDAPLDDAEAEHFDAVAQAPRKIGRYIVVNTKED